MIARDYFALKERCIYAFLSRCACSQNFIAAHSAGSAPPKLEYQAAHPRKLRKRRRKAHKELAGRCTSAFKKDRMSVLNLSADPISAVDRCSKSSAAIGKYGRFSDRHSLFASCIQPGIAFRASTLHRRSWGGSKPFRRD
jgi:hypothetical protein